MPVITKADAPVYRDAARQVREVLKRFIADTSKEMLRFLRTTHPAKQGVPPDKLIVDLMRYVRIMTHKELYQMEFYTDSLPEGGNVTVFRELDAALIDV